MAMLKAIAIKIGMYLEAAASFILIMLVNRIGFVVQLIWYVHPLLLVFTCSQHWAVDKVYGSVCSNDDVCDDVDDVD